MTNEQIDTTYNYGLAHEFFGIHQKKAPSAEDISGIYYSKRSIDKGFARFTKYLAGIMPIQKTDQEGLFKIMGGVELKNIGKNFYQHSTENGLNYKIHHLSNQSTLESYTSDYEKIPVYELVFVIFLVFGMLFLILFSLLSLLLSLIRLIRKKNRNFTIFKKINIANLLISFINSLLFFQLWLGEGDYYPNFVKVISFSFMTLGLISLVCIGYQLYNRIKGKNKTSDLIGALILQIPVLSIVFFQLYNYWA